MLIEVDWTDISDERHRLWLDQLCLYAYLHPRRAWLLYLGKADFCTVRQRLRGAHKDRLFEDCWNEFGIDEFRVLHGRLVLDDGCRRSSELLSDVESLLIKRLLPFGNIQCRTQRIARPNTRVVCSGDWPFKRARFHDVY